MNKDQKNTLPLRKISLLFSSCVVYHNKTHGIPYPAISAILDVILNIYSAEKQQQHASQIFRLQLLLKTIRKNVINTF